MRAVGYQHSRPIEADDSLVDITLDRPTPGPRDLLVAVRAVSVNPVDTKLRVRQEPEPGRWRVLGWDASGVVTAVGPDVSGFKPGDEVYYSGAMMPPGSNAEFQCVDERLVALKPKSLNWAQAAALPLTAVTAWEMLFDRLDLKTTVPGAASAVLIVGGAGGVGSIAIQLARHLTDLTVIGTASRPETTAWTRDMGAHHVIDHRESLARSVKDLGLGAPGVVFSTTHTDVHLADIADLIAPQGRFGVIDDPATLDINPFKRKSASVHWEFMFTRSLFQTPDMGRQGEILADVARLVDEGVLKTTLSDVLGPINAANLKEAHRRLESSTVRGKLVLEGFGA